MVMIIHMLRQFRKIRLILIGFIGSILFKIVHRNGFDPRQTILIFGSIRSGTTWLAEVLSSLDGYIQIFEPLHPDYVPEVSRIFTDRNPYIPPHQDWPEGHSLFSKIHSGKLINSWIMSQVSLLKIFKAKRLVVKYVRGNLLLEWLVVNMDVLTPILMIRHPCAIISSQLNKGWQPGKKLLLNNPYLDHYPDIRRECERLSEPEELAALAWCLRYHAPLMSRKPYQFVLVCYEKLVRNGKEELIKIFNILNIPLENKAIAQLSIPSDTVTSISQVVKGKDPLAGWREKLTKTQCQNILNVLHIFSMDFYDFELEPNYEKLFYFGLKRVDD